MFRAGRSAKPQDRVIAVSVALGIHAAFFGGIALTQLHPSLTPPEPIIEISFMSKQPTAPVIAPPRPSEAPPPPQASSPPPPMMMATPVPTPSPIIAQPVERTAVSDAPAPPSPPAPPAPAAVPVPLASSAAAAAPGPVTPPNFTAAYLNNPGATYPPIARRNRQQGTVRLRVQVSAEGAPVQVLVDRSSGFKDLDDAAVDVVKRRWKFVPAKQGDRPVSAWVLVPMEFSLTR